MPVIFDIVAKLKAQGVDDFVRSTRQKLSGINIPINIDARASTGLNRLNKDLASVQKSMSSMQNTAKATSKSLDATADSANDGAKAFQNFAEQAGLAARRFLAFSVAAGAIIKVIQSVKDGVKAAIEFELSMNKLAQVSGETGDRIAAVRGEITRLSTSLGVSSSKLAEVSVVLKQAGLSAREVKQGLEAIALTDLAPNFDDMKQTTEGLIAVYRQFGVQAKDFKSILGSINAVAGDFAVEASDLITAVQKAGGAFAAVSGQSRPAIEALAEFQGLFTSVRATTRESADTIATGLRTIFTRFQRGDTVQALKEFGINLRFTAEEARQLGDLNLENQFVGAFEAVKRLSSGLKDIRETDPRFSGIVEQLGGFRQISKVIPLLQQQSEAQKAVNTALAGQISLDIAAEKRQETLSNKLSVLTEKYLALFRTLGESSFLQALTSSLLKVGNAFAVVVEQASPLIPLITTLAAIKVGANLGSIIRGVSDRFTSPVGSVARRNSGGYVPGVGNTDSVRALLTPGEFVINKESAAKIGASNLNKLNRYNKGGFVGFNDGGFVRGVGDKSLELTKEQNALFSANLKLVERVIKKLESGSSGQFVRRLGDDAQSVGMIALARAAQDFNQGGDAQFSTVATKYIRTAIKNEATSFFGGGGAKSGEQQDLTKLPSSALPPDEALIRKQEEIQLAKQKKIVESAIKTTLPTNYRETQGVAKWLGIKSGGVSEVQLTNQIAEAVKKPIQQVSFENIIGGIAKAIDISGGTAGTSKFTGTNKTDFGARTYTGSFGDRDLLALGKSLKLNGIEFTNLVKEVKDLASEAGKLGDYLAGTSKAVIKYQQGTTPQILGFVNGASNVGRPTSGNLSSSAVPTTGLLNNALASNFAQSRSADNLADFLRTDGKADPDAVSAYRKSLKGSNLDYFKIKQNALEKFRQGASPEVILSTLQGSLTPSQYRQLELQFDVVRRRDEGFTKTDRNISGAPSSPGFFGRANNFISSSIPSGIGSRLSGLATNIGTGALIGTPLVAGLIESRAGSAANAIGGGEAGFRTNRGLAGALQFGTVGAAAGAAVGGPIGAAVGGVAGGLIGLVSALKDAESEIRQVKINNALSGIQDKIGVLSNLGSNADSGVSRAIKVGLEDYRKETSEKNKSAATSLFGSFDINQYSALQRSSNRQDLGPQLAQIMGTLQNDAERIGRSNPGKNIEDLVKILREGNQGVNQEFISIVANLRDLPIAQIEKDLRKSILSGQQANRLEAVAAQTRQNQERDVNTFNRLLLAIQESTDSLLKLKQSASGLNDLFDGVINSSRISGRGDNLEQLGRRDRGALIPLQLLANVGGETGRGLLSSGKLVDDLSRALPTAIATAIAAAPDNPEFDLSTAITRQLRGQLGEGKDINRLIQSVTARLDEEIAPGKGGSRNLIKQAETDVTELSKKLIQGLAGPIQDIGARSVKLLEDRGNELVDGLTSLANRVRQIGEIYDQLANLRSGRARQQLEFSATNRGRQNQSFDLIPLSVLEGGFNANQRRLAGNNAFNPAGIGQQLANNAKALDVAIKRQQNIFEKEGPSKNFQDAANEVIRLKNNSADLNQALKNLADVTSRNAVIQEKLNRLGQEREGRLGLAERFATAGPEETARLNRGFLLANQANNRGNLNGFGTDDRRLIIETLKSAGGTTLSGFSGSPRADDLLRNLLSNSFGGAFKLDANQTNEERGLQKLLIDRFKIAEEATTALITTLENNSNAFFTNLTQQQAQFFTRLEALLSKEQITKLENRRGEVGTELQKLRGLGGQKNLLASGGIVNTEQVLALQGKRNDLLGIQSGIQSRDLTASSYLSAVSKLDKANPIDFFSATREVNANKLKDDSQLQVLNRLSKDLGLTDTQSKDVLNRFNSTVNSQLKDGLGQKINLTPDAAASDLQKILKNSILQQRIADSDLANKGISDSLRGFSGIKGVDTNKLADILGGKSGSDFIKAIDSFSANNKLESLQQNIEKTAKEFENLNKQLKEFGPKGPAINKASGGSIGFHPGRPMGTDTVPAWLTPGEFVVNARAAQGNLGLLNSINSGGASYFANGGLSRRFNFLANSGATASSLLNSQRGLAVKANLVNALGNGLGADRKNILTNLTGNAALNFEKSALSRRRGIFGGISRPGDEGQKAVADSVAQLGIAQTRAILANDPYYNRFITNNTSPTNVLLKRFSGGGSVRRYAKGGKVNYLAGGGQAQSSGAGQDVSAFNNLANSLNNFVQQIGGFSETSKQLSQSFNIFAGNATALTQAISSMPRSLSIEGQHNVVVTINGAEALGKITPQIKDMVSEEVSKSLGRIFKEQLPDAGIQVN